jgi:hypothetical protein
LALFDIIHQSGGRRVTQRKSFCDFIERGRWMRADQASGRSQDSMPPGRATRPGGGEMWMRGFMGLFCIDFGLGDAEMKFCDFIERGGRIGLQAARRIACRYGGQRGPAVRKWECGALWPYFA